MKLSRALFLLVSLFGLTNCSTVMHREMLGKAIAEFSTPIKDPNPDRVSITNMVDSDCNSGKGASKLTASNGQDLLAFEVFANFLTQKRKGKVVEPHRHNYATDLGVETHPKSETVVDNKHIFAPTGEDLCLLDEAKKRKADKVLAYSIVELQNDELKIHLRFSDVRSGLVEFSRSLFVVRGTVSDISF